jgi:osmotically-inducible protein OsmY
MVQDLEAAVRRDLHRAVVRPDAEIAADVRSVITSLLGLDPAAVSVSVRRGVAELAGPADGPDVAAAAVRLAADTDGVLAVVDKLDRGPARPVTPGRPPA